MYVYVTFGSCPLSVELNVPASNNLVQYGTFCLQYRNFIFQPLWGVDLRIVSHFLKAEVVSKSCLRTHTHSSIEYIFFEKVVNFIWLMELL